MPVIYPVIIECERCKNRVSASAVSERFTRFREMGIGPAEIRAPEGWEVRMQESYSGPSTEIFCPECKNGEDE